MPKFKSNVILANVGRVAHKGDIVTMTEKEAEPHLLKGNISPLDEEGQSVTETKHDAASFKQLSAQKQKAVVIKLKGDIDELTNEDLRWEYVEAHQ